MNKIIAPTYKIFRLVDPGLHSVEKIDRLIVSVNTITRRFLEAKF